MAEQSEISQKQVTVDQIKAIFMKFKEDMYETLLFVNNIENICLKEVKEVAGNEIIEEIYSVHIEMSDEAKRSRSDFQRYACEMAS